MAQGSSNAVTVSTLKGKSWVACALEDAEKSSVRTNMRLNAVVIIAVFTITFVAVPIENC
jgi:hypothetical protein